MKRSVYQAIVSHRLAMQTCNNEWRDRHGDAIDAIEANHLPSGSGFDSGTSIGDISDDRIVLTTAFHHMDDHGFYVGWSHWRIVVRASLSMGIDVQCRCTGGRSIFRHRDPTFRDFIAETFYSALSAETEL